MAEFKLEDCMNCGSKVADIRNIIGWEGPPVYTHIGSHGESLGDICRPFTVATPVRA